MIVADSAFLFVFTKMVAPLNTTVSSGFRCESPRFEDHDW